MVYSRACLRRTEPQYQHEHQRQPPKKTPGAMRLWLVARARAAGNSAGLCGVYGLLTVLYGSVRWLRLFYYLLTVILRLFYGYFTAILRLVYGTLRLLYGCITDGLTVPTVLALYSPPAWKYGSPPSGKCCHVNRCRPKKTLGIVPPPKTHLMEKR